MILIKKGDAPPSLQKYQKEAHANYDGCNKDDIRDQLLEEQGHLCAYCMRRIYKETMKIEHWYPEDRMNDKECLDYSNMLGCCPGHKEGHRGKQDTCDTHKRNDIIAINPTNPVHIDRISYRSRDGAICSDEKMELVRFKSERGIRYEEETSFQKDLDGTLNLNENSHYLKQNRKAVLEGVKKVLDKRNKDGWSVKNIEKMISEYEKVDEHGCKKEYAGIVLWYLRKKLDGKKKK